MTLRIPKWLLVGLAVLVLTGAGVAGLRLLENEGPGEDGDPGAAEPPIEKAAAVDARKCEQQAGDFLRELEGLESRVILGVAYVDYLERVNEARLAYQRIPVDALDLACVEVAAPAERVLTTHLEAAEVWTKCVRDRDCGNASILPKLRRKWEKASTQLEESRQAMRALRQ